MTELKHKETEFKSVSKTAQSLQSELDKDSVRAMLMDLKQTKQKLLLISSKASERIKVLPSLITQVSHVILYEATNTLLLVTDNK